MRTVKLFQAIVIVMALAGLVACSSGGGGGSSDESGPPPIDGFEWIKGGTFAMGSNDTLDRYANPPHQVTVSSFYMGKYQVTQEQYQAVMGNNPSAFTTANGFPSVLSETDAKRPVETVSWYEAIVFCNRLSVMQGLTPVYSIYGSTEPNVWIAGAGGSIPNNDNATWSAVIADWSANGYRLPTEAEWEYICRAGTTTAYNTGDTISDDTGWYRANSGGTTHEVGQKPANTFGLYDMYGNVWEWCWDWYDAYPDPPEAKTDPLGAATGLQRVVRGGSCRTIAQYLRSADRSAGVPAILFNLLGFRLVRPYVL